jgi:hypothetical protein
MSDRRMVRLHVLADYRSREVAYVEGSTIEVLTTDADFLLRDAPGCFEIFKPEAPEAPQTPETPEEPEAPEGKAPKGPAKDKMVKDSDQK